MIKAEVIFDWNEIRVGKYKITYDDFGEVWDIVLIDNLETSKCSLEQAIKYCLEN